VTGDLRETTLRRAALAAGLVPAADTHPAVDEQLAAIGKKLFESTLVSPGDTIACATCHVDRFGSADGLPQAIGVGGKGLGPERMRIGGEVVPRNTLPFWGRGGVGFERFFWDGKVDGATDTLRSQFGDQLPTDDALVLAVHLPPVELGEMAGVEAEAFQTETVASASKLYAFIAERIANDPELGSELAKARSKEQSSIEFLDIAEAIAAFIRFNFKVQDTRFHDFVFAGRPLSASEIEGGLVFYGKGGCAVCHNGPYFSDFEFRAIPFPPAGFGVNGFGFDYGRYNVTLNPIDRSTFRTPPLLNVRKTGPYGHSGSVRSLADAIKVHFDPLALMPEDLSASQRTAFYSQLRPWAREPIPEITLDNEDISNLIAFLGTLEYEAKWPVVSD